MRDRHLVTVGKPYVESPMPPSHLILSDLAGECQCHSHCQIALVLMLFVIVVPTLNKVLSYLILMSLRI